MFADRFTQCIMAQSSNRWASKILALPVFNDVFAKAVMESPFSDLALISAMDVHSAEAFVVKVHEWSGQLSEEVRTPLLDHELMLQQFWCLASSVEKAFFESTAHQLGFGLCDPVTMAISAETARSRRSLALKSLLERPANQPRKALKQTVVEDTSTPLLDHENALRAKWALRLEAIGQKAGSHSKLLVDTTNSEGLTALEHARLRKLVLSSGAPRTMAVHITTWERFAEWMSSQSLEVFPLTNDKLLKYALALDLKYCGPSVVPSFRTSVKWVTSKLAIDCPDLSHPALIAVQDEIIRKRAKTLKEAVPIPIAAVGCMEKFVTDEGEPPAARVFAWWWLCMVFASLRYDDAMHVKPDELKLEEEGLFGVAWQTKVERRRRGTKFVIPKVGFSDARWLETGWMLFQMDDLDRDFWMCDLNTRSSFSSKPADYQRSVQWLRFLAAYSVNHYFVGEEKKLKDMISSLNQVTAHSARVTLLDAAVHAGRSTEEIGLQANWKNPGPLVLKYTRNRTSVPAHMVTQLVKDLADQAHPVQDSDDVDLAADDTALDELQFYVKSQGSRTTRDYRYHCLQLGSEDTIACGRVQFDQCSLTGSTLPDQALLCKHCAKARPDVASRCFRISATSSSSFLVIRCSLLGSFSNDV